jgi:RNA polymerase sigma factor (TIGR02999 family)
VDSESAPPPEDASPGQATLFLRAVAAGDEAASDRLLEIVYAELRGLAGAVLRREREGHTLQPTALVHEAWLRLVGQDQVEWQNRAHFFGIASLAMRRVVVDHARARARDKRGSGAQREPLHTGIVGGEADLDLKLDVLALNEGLERLAEHSERAAKVVELRFFGGLTEEETARVLGVARPTITRDWRAARAWLSNWMKPGSAG